MPEKPLVSVMTPAYNSGRTISFALASLIAQTYENWECVVVDDGSEDDTVSRAAAFQDPRIRIIKLGSNKGEASARQRAYEESRGALYAMLDADDWYYPDKLARQVALILGQPEAALVSCGMAVTDGNNDLAGIRAVGCGAKEVYQIPGALPVAHAPSLFWRRESAQLAYDLSLRSSIDADFLRRLLQGREFIVMPYIGYCYRELGSARLGKIVAGYYYNARGLAKFLKVRPMPVAWSILQELGKIVVYMILGPLGLFRVLIKRRSWPPSAAEREEFIRAKAVVEAVHKRILAEKAR